MIVDFAAMIHDDSVSLKRALEQSTWPTVTVILERSKDVLREDSDGGCTLGAAAVVVWERWESLAGLESGYGLTQAVGAERLDVVAAIEG